MPSGPAWDRNGPCASPTPTEPGVGREPDDQLAHPADRRGGCADRLRQGDGQDVRIERSDLHLSSSPAMIPQARDGSSPYEPPRRTSRHGLALRHPDWMKISPGPMAAHWPSLTVATLSCLLAVLM